MEPEQGIRAWQWIVTVIVIIILIVLGYYMFKGNNGAAPTGTNNGTSTDMTSDANEINRVVVSDQYPGNVVYVSSVQLANPGWIVIRKDDNGKPGAIVGQAYFDKGINPGKITLTENTKDGQVYYAELHSDDGDKKFDAAKDLTIKDSRGSDIMKIFRATSNITEVKG